ncbi:MAG: efflux RND transporter periplasmic adaptor subunit [Parachlamydiales bacterium]|nr:efflux RND transporter periplasmic adaptor subunit [Parachlamydiales bacterium]
MQTLEEKKIVIKLPQIRLQSFLSIRFAIALALLLFSSGFAYWYRNVRPYLSIPSAHINAYSTVLSSDKAGRIAEIGPQEGDRVKKGAFLFSFDRDVSQHEQKKGSLELLQQQIDFEKGQMIKAMEGYLAASSDFEMGIGEQETVQKHLLYLEDAQKRAEEAQAKAAAIQKELDSTHAEMKKGAFFAPFEGIILRRYKNEGEVCSIGDRIYSLCDLDRLWVETEVSEKQIRSIAIGTPARIRVNAYPNREFAGKVSYIGSATVAKSDHLPLSQQEEMIPIKITFESKDLSLKPGLSAKVDLKVH